MPDVDPKSVVIDIAKLAQILHRAPSTIATEVSKAPHKLPPRIKLPGTRRVLWLLSDVETWIAAHRNA